MEPEAGKGFYKLLAKDSPAEQHTVRWLCDMGCGSALDRRPGAAWTVPGTAYPGQTPGESRQVALACPSDGNTAGRVGYDGGVGYGGESRRAKGLQSSGIAIRL